MHFTVRRHRISIGFSSVLLSAVLALAPVDNSYAQGSSHHHKKKHHHAVYVRAQPASLVVDARTGKILESENADALRYPASLTKMMTLYLTFDALKKGKMRLDEMLPVSEHASEQPQTNIALESGDRIAVKDAILSIVVRSANDSAVTLGEAIGGGSESRCAELMSAKARQLGMKHTVFYNASGLPNPAQHTTARDMATLGLALRRNFPEYFPFFKTESFSYRGKTYITHNHVMTRYDGVDGIKTGFIRASGYNLVTSANRDGHTLIGVVLGGPTWRARDDKMIALLNKSFTDMADLPGGNRVQLASSVRSMNYSVKPEANDESMEGEGDSSPAKAGTGAQPQQMASASGGAWGVQVGSYAKPDEAGAAAIRAMREAPQELGSAAITVASDKDMESVHHAQLTGLSQAQAQSACQKLVAFHETCTAVHAE